MKHWVFWVSKRRGKRPLVLWSEVPMGSCSQLQLSSSSAVHGHRWQRWFWSELANFVVHDWLSQLRFAGELKMLKLDDEKPRPPQINWDDPKSGAPLGGTKLHFQCRELPDGSVFAQVVGQDGRVDDSLLCRFAQWRHFSLQQGLLHSGSSLGPGRHFYSFDVGEAKDMLSSSIIHDFSYLFISNVLFFFLDVLIGDEPWLEASPQSKEQQPFPWSPLSSLPGARDALGGVSQTTVLGPLVTPPESVSQEDLTNALAAQMQIRHPSRASGCFLNRIFLLTFWYQISLINNRVCWHF